MTNDIERHSPDEWRKTAAALMPESSSAGAEESAAAANGGLQVHPSSVPQFAGAAVDSH